MGAEFTLEIITPYRVLFSGKVEEIIFRSSDGEFGVLANREPFVAPVCVSAVRILAGGAWRTAAVTDGIVEMADNRAVMLTGAAEWPEEIDVPRAERAR